MRGAEPAGSAVASAIPNGQRTSLAASRSISSIAFFSGQPVAILASTSGHAYLWNLERRNLMGAWAIREAQTLFFTPDGRDDRSAADILAKP